MRIHDIFATAVAFLSLEPFARARAKGSSQASSKTSLCSSELHHDSRLCILWCCSNFFLCFDNFFIVVSLCQVLQQLTLVPTLLSEVFDIECIQFWIVECNKVTSSTVAFMSFA